MPAVEEIEEILNAANSSGQLPVERAKILQQFFDDARKNALALYESGLIVTSRTYDREEIARFWARQRQFFEAQLALVNSFQRKLKYPLSRELDLSSVIDTLENLVAAASEHYEFHV
jgi:hypothetical protein